MRIGRNEIVEELMEHIRKSGGEPGEWRVGTAQDLPEREERMPGLAYREAHTPYAANEAVEYLADAFGLQRDRDSAPGTGKIVFVCRSKAPAAPANAGSSPPVFRRLAA